MGYLEACDIIVRSTKNGNKLQRMALTSKFLVGKLEIVQKPESINLELLSSSQLLGYVIEKQLYGRSIFQCSR